MTNLEKALNGLEQITTYLKKDMGCESLGFFLKDNDEAQELIFDAVREAQGANDFWVKLNLISEEDNDSTGYFECEENQWVLRRDIDLGPIKEIIQRCVVSFHVAVRDDILYLRAEFNYEHHDGGRNGKDVQVSASISDTEAWLAR